MKNFNAVLLAFTATIIVVSMLIVSRVSGAAEIPSVKQDTAKGGAPAGGSAPGVDTATTELSSSYSMEILAPSGIPVKTLHFKKDAKGNISGTMDSEHGTQNLTKVSFDGKTLKFTALSGSNGDESFDFTMKFYTGGILLGECEGGRGPSPVVLKTVK